MSKFLEVKNLSVFYGAVQALDNVSIEINKGEIVTMIGGNGAGKSTLLMSIYGDPKPKSGSIYYNGNNISEVPTHRISSSGIAISPEGRRIFPKMTVEENLDIGCDNFPHINKSKNKEKMFDYFPILKQRRSQTAGTLSGGEQQMLSIGRALMSEPQLLLLDEPSLGLAPMIVSQIFRIVKDISKEGVTIFLVEQNAFHALKLADRGYVLVNGSIKMHDNADVLLTNPEVRNAYLSGH